MKPIFLCCNVALLVVNSQFVFDEFPFPDDKEEEGLFDNVVAKYTALCANFSPSYNIHRGLDSSTEEELHTELPVAWSTPRRSHIVRRAINP